MKRIVIIAAALLFACSALDAKVTLPSIISDNMVLQQKTDAALWGTAKPGAKVAVMPSWTKAKTYTTADQDGKWFIRVATPQAGGPYTITFSDGEKLTISNVLIGEVWFCSGQSNMEMPVKGFRNQPVEGSMEFISRAKASTPIRMCTIQKNSNVTPQAESKGSWEENVPAAVANCSAAAYFFAEQLQTVLGIPVGLLISDWGGSSIETWLDRETIEAKFKSEFKLDYLDGKGEVPTNKRHQLPCLLYNGQVNPAVPFTFKGMLWYQGETNRGRAEQYTRLQTAYVEMMRKLFEVPDAPFYFVQIAPYPYGEPSSFASGYFYEAQENSLKTIPNSGMAVIIDIGEYGTIHPCKKIPVGRRLANLALQKTYGYGMIGAEAPTYNSVSFSDGAAVVKFNVDAMGLSPMGQDLGGFELAGEDKVFHPATARLQGADAMVVKSAEVPNPVAVRYCFRNWAVGTVFNCYGVPAAPFRTDDWKL